MGHAAAAPAPAAGPNPDPASRKRARSGTGGGGSGSGSGNGSGIGIAVGIRGGSTGSRTRSHDPDATHRPAKQPRRAPEPVHHALLAQYYAEVQTLRQYALSRLPASSRLRRRKISRVGLGPGQGQGQREGQVQVQGQGQGAPKSLAAEPPLTETEIALGELLDTTLVARRHPAPPTQDVGPDPDASHRWDQWVAFSQKGDESYVTLSDGLRGSIYSQSELVDFVIWLLFSREPAGSWPRHILCDGFRRVTGPGNRPNAAAPTTAIPGLYLAYPNQHVQALKAPPWPQLLMLLGKEGERIMLDLLVDCAVFRSVKAGRGNLYQLVGTPVSELEPLSQLGDKEGALKKTELRPSEISFVRSRMLYARAALNARGLVHFGLRHIHVLNRFPSKDQPAAAEADRPEKSVVHIMMYMFPRQFGLHNAFTSAVDRRQTSQKFQDYTLREEEIASKFPSPADGGKPASHVPKRLRGAVVHLVRRLQVLHKRCSYAEMLHHYCPAPGQVGSQDKTQPASSRPLPSSSRPQAAPVRTLPPSSRPQAKGAKRTRKSRPSAVASVPDLQYSSLTDLATPVSSVSAFCQAVLSKVVPDVFWGKGDVQEHNKSCFLKKVHHFVHLRRFESMCLHEVMQGMKINDIEWLAPPALGNQKSSQSDTRKRTEIFYEFLYYLVDSFLIPLIRSNFYVTESNVDRYRLFFFRHDVWRYVAEPAMALLKTNMFEEVKTDDALRILQGRRLGYSHVRLLPKRDKMRPIMNLRRRTLLQGNKKVLGPSINTVLGPVSSMLKLEKARRPDRLGASLFSVGDIYPRLKAFKASLGPGPPYPNLYFAKVDVQSAFDTIPQDAMLALLRRIPQQAQYKMLKHAEVAPLESTTTPTSTAPKTTKRWHTVAVANTDSRTFPERVEGAEMAAGRKRNTVFVDSAMQWARGAGELLALTEAHVRENLVRVGKRYYRQREGIPQGSVLSATMSNYFYADLERECLAFLGEGGGGCLLLRLIDDFLLITTEEDKARRFVEVMHTGLPAYGVRVSPGKSLVNFGMVWEGREVPRVEEGGGFPYCGLVIDCGTLGVRKGGGGGGGAVFNSLTVEYGHAPGRNFTRKVLNAFKIQSHLMFFDAAHNSRPAVLANIHAAFAETATKMWAYARCMARGARPGKRVLIDTIKTLIDAAFALLTSRARAARYPGYVCRVGREEVAWLAMVAFRQVLVQRQTGYSEVVAWLERETRALTVQGKGVDAEMLVGVVRGAGARRRRKGVDGV